MNCETGGVGRLSESPGVLSPLGRARRQSDTPQQVTKAARKRVGHGGGVGATKEGGGGGKFRVLF